MRRELVEMLIQYGDAGFRNSPQKELPPEGKRVQLFLVTAKKLKQIMNAIRGGIMQGRLMYHARLPEKLRLVVLSSGQSEKEKPQLLKLFCLSVCLYKFGSMSGMISLRNIQARL